MATNDIGLLSSGTKINKVFVYGTLMKGFSNYKRFLEGRIIKITPVRTYGLLYHLREVYPALIAGNETVEGEIIEPVDENLLESLDRLEGYNQLSDNNLYNREIRSVFTEDGEEILCWVYIYADENYAKEYGIPVPDGNWRKFMMKYMDEVERKRTSYKKGQFLIENSELDNIIQKYEKSMSHNLENIELQVVRLRDIPQNWVIRRLLAGFNLPEGYGGILCSVRQYFAE